MMLRICYCISHYHPIASGAERQAHRQAVELVRRGHRVHVLTRAVADRPECEEVDGVAIQRQIRPVELGPGFGLSFVATLCRGLWRLRGEFDVMHCHQALWEAVASGVMCGRLRKPSVVQPAAGGEFGEVWQLGRTRGRGLLRRWILHNSHFVAISGQIEHELCELGVPAARLTRLASGVDTDEFTPGSSSVEPALPPRPRVIFLGRLHAQKNLRVLLQAWPAVRRDVPAVLLLAGDGPDREPLRELARTLGVADSVCFLGPVADPRDYLRAADAFVLPSVAEGMSNSLLEAMAVGVPSAVSRIGGNDDLVRHEESGLLVEAGNVAGWSRAIVRLLTDQARARQMGRAARELVEKRFSITAIVDRYVALYEWLLAGGDASSSRSF
jgi:glycosyltransferase involved in cell wall biosynthesis